MTIELFLVAVAYRPQIKLVAPDQLPMFAFIRGFHPRHVYYRATPYYIGKRSIGTFPEWQYDLRVPGQKVAHRIKASLLARDGWTLRFPSTGQPFDARAVHSRSGAIPMTDYAMSVGIYGQFGHGADWHLITKYFPVQHQIFIIVWDESRDVSKPPYDLPDRGKPN